LRQYGRSQATQAASVSNGAFLSRPNEPVCRRTALAAVCALFQITSAERRLRSPLDSRE
jgi:hypothetical protein